MPATLSALCLAIVLLLVIIWRWRRSARVHWMMNRLPQGPRPLPFIGNALELIGGYDRTLDTMQVKWPEKYGEIYVTYVGTHRNVNISSPEFAEKLLSSNKILDKGADYEFLYPWLGDGLLLSTGTKWKGRRKLLTPAFHYQILENFMDVFNKQVRILCQILNDHSAGQPPGILDVFPLIINYTLDIICEAAMGTEIHSQTKTSDYVKAILRINQIMVERMSNPVLASNFLFRMSPKSAELDRLLGVVHNFSEKVIQGRRELLKQQEALIGMDIQIGNESGLKNRRPLLDILLHSSVAAGLSDRDIRDEIDTFMFEGHDTTAAAITWFLYCIAEHPEHQVRIWQELQDVFADDMGRDVTLQDLSLLTYLECCIKESGRLYTTVPMIERFTTEESQIGEYLIPEGTSLLLLLYRIHRNPRLFPDPLIYNPERFLPDQSTGRPPFCYIPFSAGPRNCIGFKFAQTEVKVTAATLLRRFKFAVSRSCKKPIPSWQLVLKPLRGIELIICPR